MGKVPQNRGEKRQRHIIDELPVCSLGGSDVIRRHEHRAEHEPARKAVIGEERDIERAARCRKAYRSKARERDAKEGLPPLDDLADDEIEVACKDRRLARFADGCRCDPVSEEELQKRELDALLIGGAARERSFRKKGARKIGGACRQRAVDEQNAHRERKADKEEDAPRRRRVDEVFARAAEEHLHKRDRKH